ncbi:MAG: hypothetical protein IH622_20825 [Ochrobactrum anthropi]|uniref:Uncharacterized protein n=1 Tax=Brucella anthropi TaxID=529 RepID=A0A8I0N6Y6_BRUAN|nr:hypothetical protein [Brucella anthropi]MBE0563239.1 hypothetical protein [Brucella anthropi]
MRTALKLAAVLSAFIVVAPAGPASAMDTQVLATAAASYEDGAAAQQLEDRLADLIEAGDKAGLEALATQIERDDGPILEALAVLMEENGPALDGTKPAHSDELARLAMAMGPCHQANIALRSIVLLVSAGEAEPVVRNGIVMIHGSEIDSTYARLIHICEKIKKLPAHRPRIGSRCSFTGICGDDPDMN